MDDVIRMSRKTDDTTDFQRASHTIAAASKIYGVRVDSVYNDTYKILGNISKNARNDASAEVADSGACHRRVYGRNTRAKPEAINEELRQLIVEVDPLFHKTASAFDEGGAKGLLMNQLYVSNGCQILFDADTKIDDIDGDVEMTDVCDIHFISRIHTCFSRSKKKGKSHNESKCGWNN